MVSVAVSHMWLGLPAAVVFFNQPPFQGGSVAKWLACWTQAQKARDQIAAAALWGNSLRQTVRFISPSSKIGSSPLKGCRGNWRKVMAAYRRVYDSRHLQADCQEPGSAPEPYAW